MSTDEYYREFEDYDFDAPSSLASSFGFYSQSEFDEYCDEMERNNDINDF